MIHVKVDVRQWKSMKAFAALSRFPSSGQNSHTPLLQWRLLGTPNTSLLLPWLNKSALLMQLKGSGWLAWMPVAQSYASFVVEFMPQSSLWVPPAGQHRPWETSLHSSPLCLSYFLHILSSQSSVSLMPRTSDFLLRLSDDPNWRLLWYYSQ